MMDFWLLIHEHPAWVWMAIAAVFLAAELVTGSGWMLWPAGSAGLTAMVAAAETGWNPTTQALVFTLVTGVSTFGGRRWLRSRIDTNADDLKDSSARLVGRVAEAASPFLSGSGRVFIDGRHWPAELEGGGAAEQGARVEVTALLHGSRLRVRALS